MDEYATADKGVDFSALGEPMEDGVYFGLPEDEYHAAKAFSASGIKNMLVSSMDFWARSWMNPLKDDEEDSAARAVGKAYHMRIVEGSDRFYENYAAALDPADYPNVLRTSDEIKAALEHAGLKKSGNKADLVARLTENNPNVQIWDVMLEDHQKFNEGKTLLAADLIRKIELSAAMIEKHPKLKKAFAGGYPEVSIFWHDESGIPMKSRLDFMKIRAIVDLKTFSNPFGKPIDRAVTYAMASYKYHIQVAVYFEAVEYAKRLIQQGKIFGEVEKGWSKKFIEADEPELFFVFQQTGVSPVARGYILPKTLIYDCAKVEVRDAKTTFINCVKTFGVEPWLDMTDIRSLEDHEFPIWMTGP